MPDIAPTESRRRWSVWLVGLYIVALVVLPVDIGIGVAGVVITPARIVLLLAALFALVEWRSVLAALGRIPRLIWIGWAAFLAAALVTAIVWPSSASWARYGSLVGEGIVVFALVAHAATAPRGVLTLMWVFVASMAAVAAAVILLALFGLRYDHVLSGLAGSVPAANVLDRYGLERQAGSFRGAAYFGIWLTAASALLLPALEMDKGKRRWVALAAWLVLVVAALTMTGSRLAMTMVFVLPGVYFFVRGRRALGLASLLVAGGVVLGVSLVPANYAIQNSTTVRIAAVHASFDAVRAHPLFGWGLLNDMSALGEVLGKRNFVDNTYLSIAVEMGLVGLAAFLLLVFSVLFAIRRMWRSAQGLALTLALLGVLAMAVLISVLQTTQGYAVFWVIAALAVVSATNRSQPAIQVDERA